MQALIELTEGLARLEAIIASFPPASSHWNEAENRFQFVDRLLTECLGWERPFIQVESTDEAGGRADYILGHPPKAVLEAKREAKHFGSLPIGKPTNVRKLGPMIKASADFEFGRTPGTPILCNAWIAAGHCLQRPPNGDLPSTHPRLFSA